MSAMSLKATTTQGQIDAMKGVLDTFLKGIAELEAVQDDTALIFAWPLNGLGIKFVGTDAVVVGTVSASIVSADHRLAGLIRNGKGEAAVIMSRGDAARTELPSLREHRDMIQASLAALETEG